MSVRSIFDSPNLRSELDKAGISLRFIPYIWKHVVKNPNLEWTEIPDLPSVAYPILSSKFSTSTSTVHSVIDSSDGVTTKLIIKLQVHVFSCNSFYSPTQINPLSTVVVDLEWSFGGSSDNEVRHVFRKIWRQASTWWVTFNFVRIITGTFYFSLFSANQLLLYLLVLVILLFPAFALFCLCN